MCGTDYYYASMPELAMKLDEIVPVQRPTPHFANSGTEAVETALKLAMHATGRESSSRSSAVPRPHTGIVVADFFRAAQRPASSVRCSTSCTCLIERVSQPFNADDCGDSGVVQGAINWIENRLFKTTTPPEELPRLWSNRSRAGRLCPSPAGFMKELRGFVTSMGFF